VWVQVLEALLEEPLSLGLPWLVETLLGFINHHELLYNTDWT
jgi:hypothetical protein